MTTKIKSISNPRLELQVLSPDDVRRIHGATLDIIESIGVRFPLPRALDIWEAKQRVMNAILDNLHLYKMTSVKTFAVD